MESAFYRYAWKQNKGKFWHLFLAMLGAFLLHQFDVFDPDNLQPNIMLTIFVGALLWEKGEFVWRKVIRDDLSSVYVPDFPPSETAEERFFLDSFGDFVAGMIGAMLYLLIFTTG